MSPLQRAEEFAALTARLLQGAREERWDEWPALLEQRDACEQALRQALGEGPLDEALRATLQQAQQDNLALEREVAARRDELAFLGKTLQVQHKLQDTYGQHSG